MKYRKKEVDKKKDKIWVNLVNFKNYWLVFSIIILVIIILIFPVLVKADSSSASWTKAYCKYNGGSGGTACDSGQRGGDSASCSVANKCAEEGDIVCWAESSCETQGTTTRGPQTVGNINWDGDSADCSCKIGSGKWDIGFESGTSSKCCGDDDNEFVITETSDGIDAPSPYDGNTGTTCCDSETDCTESGTDVCTTTDSAAGTIPNRAYCGAGNTWYGGDYSSAACGAICGAIAGCNWVPGGYGSDNVKCCGDDGSESWCGSGYNGYEACLNGKHKINGDDDPYVCECGNSGDQGSCNSDGEIGCWHSSKSQCCGDDSGEQWCAGGYTACYGNTYRNDGDYNRFVCDCGQGPGYWALNGEIAANECCENDPGENRVEEKSGTDAPAGYNDGITTCCSAPTDCTYDDVCSAPSETSSPEIPNKAYCSAGTWIGGDASMEACGAVGGRWTAGNTNDINAPCCGDDLDESYSDPAVNGDACWEGSIVNHCSELVNNDRTLDEDGVLYGCNAEQLTAEGHCSLMCSGNFFCSFTDKWVDSQGRTRTKPSTWPGGGATLQTECCEQDKCWNGGICVDNQANDPTSQPYDSWRCIDGVWKEELSPKITPTGDKGYCPQDSQCLVDINGDYADNNLIDGNDDGIINPQCIADGQYIMDLYCENGKWTSRTKHVALQLLSIPTTDDYTLFCDVYENTLNYVGYKVVTDIAEDYFTWGKVNEFCVLVDEENVIIGVALNRDINAETYSFLETIGESSNYCNDALDGEDNYRKCSSDNRVWYNDGKKSIIYGDISSDLGPPADPNEKIIDPARGLIDYIIANVHDNPYSYTDDNKVNVESTRWYDRLFILQKGSYSVFGLLEAPNPSREYMAIDHQGLTTDVCSYVEAYDSAESDIDHVYCSNDRYVVSRDFINENTLGEYFSTADIWLDLTAKLRLE